MAEVKDFILELDFEGNHYTGVITPSEELGNDGMPVYFRVEIGNELFAYLCCGDIGWHDRDGHGRPVDLVNAIGDYIKKYYS